MASEAVMTFLDRQNVQHLTNGYGTRTACGVTTTRSAITSELRLDGTVIVGGVVTCIECIGTVELRLAGYVFDHGRGKWVR